MNDQEKFQAEEARRMHDRIRAQEDLHNRAAIESGAAAIKTVILANGGAIVAVLAFLGNIAGKENIEVKQIADAAQSLMWFAGGISAGLGCMLTAYLTNLNNANTAASHNLTWEHPHVSPDHEHRRYYWFSRGWQWTSIFTGVVAWGCFVYGIIEVRETLLKLAAT